MTFYKSKIAQRLFLPIIILSAILISCQDPWAERIEINEDVPAKNLFEEIMDRADISEFAAAIQTCGWDTALSSTRPYTVWAPTNEAMSMVSSDIKNDPERLYDLVSNHIVFLQYEYYTSKPDQQVKTFKEKYINLYFSDGKVDDANLHEPYDIATNNGILHIIDKPLIPKINVWEFIETTSLCPKLTTYLKTLSGYIFDPTIATQIGVDAVTGRPIYDTATGLVWDNLFLNRTLNLKSEDTLSTVVLFSDLDYDTEYGKFLPYYTYLESVDNYEYLSDSVTKWKIAKDIVFEGAILPDELPSVIKSTFGVNVPIGSFIIDSVFLASNGLVYSVSGYGIEKPDKIPVIIIEAEDTNKFVWTEGAGYTGFTRERPLASGGHDFVLDDHDANPGSMTYHIPGLVKTQYEIYWKAVQDFDYSYEDPDTTNRKISQALGWVDPAGYVDNKAIFDNFSIQGSFMELVDSTYETAEERFIDTYEIYGYENREWIQVRSDGDNGTISLDYIKFVPLFND